MMHMCLSASGFRGGGRRAERGQASGRQEGYYEQEVADGLDDYYAGRGESRACGQDTVPRSWASRASFTRASVTGPSSRLTDARADLEKLDWWERRRRGPDHRSELDFRQVALDHACDCLARFRREPLETRQVRMRKPVPSHARQTLGRSNEPTLTRPEREQPALTSVGRRVRPVAPTLVLERPRCSGWKEELPSRCPATDRRAGTVDRSCSARRPTSFDSPVPVRPCSLPSARRPPP